MGKKKKDIKSTIVTIGISIVIFLAGFFGGGLAGRVLAKFSMPFSESLISVITYIAIFIIIFGLHIILHEVGHLILGLMSGYEFISFRVGSLTLVKDEGKFKFKKFNIKGTGGQCLMMPKTDNYKELKYDSNGRVIKENVYNAPDFDECISVVREYNTQGKKSKETTYMDEEEISNIFCTYDEKDRLTRVDYSYHGSIGNWEKYIYDSNVVSVECYDSSGDLTRIYQETWSSDGSIEEEKVFDENGCLTEWKQYHYDCGKLKDKVILNSDGTKEKIYIYEYDVNNNLESENIMYTNGEFDILYSCEYELFEVESY